MVKQKQNKEGFTLIETLVVLSIVAMMSILLVKIKPGSYRLQLFFQTIKLETDKIQFQTIHDGIKRTINFQSKLVIFDKKVFYYPPGIRCDSIQFSYNSLGNISKAGTLTCYLGNDSKKIVYQLGSGKSEIR